MHSTFAPKKVNTPLTKRLDTHYIVTHITGRGVPIPAVCKGVCRISNKVRQGKMVLISDLKAFFSSIYLSGALSFIQQYDNSIFYILKAMFSVETKSYFQIKMALTPPILIQMVHIWSPASSSLILKTLILNHRMDI